MVRNGIAHYVVVGLSVASVASAGAQAAGKSPLRLESKIELGDVAGRVDHMAIDVGRKRLFVAELGNDSVSVVDLDSKKVIKRFLGLSEPQGIGYLPANDSLYIANGGDGSLRIFHGPEYVPAGPWIWGLTPTMCALIPPEIASSSAMVTAPLPSSIRLEIAKKTVFPYKHIQKASSLTRPTIACLRTCQTSD